MSKVPTFAEAIDMIERGEPLPAVPQCPGDHSNPTTILCGWNCLHGPRGK